MDVEQGVGHMPTVREPQPRRPAKQPMQAIPTTPMGLIAAASARGASADELDKLMTLMERQQDREAKQAFARAMVQFKLQVPSIIKDAGAKFVAKGAQVEYDFATLGHICEQIISVLASCGISHRWDPQQPGTGEDANLIVMTCILTHELGHKESATMKFPADPSGTKNPLQSIGSAATYGERYSLLAAVGIAVKAQPDDDGAAAGAGQSQAQPESQLEKHAIDGANLNRALASIKTNDYSYDDLVAYYALTPAQLDYVRKELNLDASK